MDSIQGQLKISKLLILDGIGGVPLGREMCTAFMDCNINSSYVDCQSLPKIRFYKLKAALAKMVNRVDSKDIFYHLPQVNLKSFKRLITDEKPTAILVIGFIYKFISPAVLNQLKSEHDFSLYLYDTDSCNLYSKRREFIFFLDKELPVYQTIFSFSKVTTRFFNETKNLNAEHVSFGAQMLPVFTRSAQKYDVLFVGSSDLRRIFLLEHIKDKVTIFGNRWQRNFPLISATLKNKITDKTIWGSSLYQHLADAKIVLNITRSNFYGAETGVNLRIFEALSAGCFLLTDYCDEIAELFVIGEEIEVFRSASELKQKVEYYLENPERRIVIAKKGYEKFVRQYTWQACVGKILTHIKLD